MWRKLSLVFIALSLSLISESKDYRFTHLTTANGISQSEVYTFLEDSHGFLWFGTVDGLNRYDGYSFKIFNTDKTFPNSLSNNTIRSLVEDSMERIWIGTDDGLNFYDQRKELIYKIKINTKAEKMSVWSMLIYEDHIFIGTNNGLWRGSINSFDLENIEKSFQKIDTFSSNAYPGDIILKLIPSKHGGFWVLTNKSISRIIFQTNKIDPIIIEDLQPADDFKEMISIVEDKSGSIWLLSTSEGVIRYNKEKKSFQQITKSNDFLHNFSKKYSTLTFDNDQKLWVASSDKGLLHIHYDFKKEEIINVESVENDPNNTASLNSNLIYSLYVSSNNKLLVGTIGSGLNILDPEFKEIQHYSIKSKSNDKSNVNFIRAVMVDKQNRILAGIHNNGLYLIDRKTKLSNKLGFDSEAIYYISEYRDDLYFVCTGNSIYLIELNGSSFKVLSNYEGLNSPVFFVVHARNDQYWCATLNGLVRVRINNNRIELVAKLDKSTQPALSANNCRVLYFDDIHNQLIVGTEGGGLNYVQLDNYGTPTDVKVHKMSDKDYSLSNNYVRSIIQDKNGTQWIGTYEGLNKVLYNSATGERTFKTYTKKDGLPNNMIEFIVEDDNNSLWLGTNGGLSKFSPNSERFLNYNMDDGLQSNEFSEHTVFKTINGEIVMGGINGINAFYPADFKDSKIKPRTLITDFYLNNELIKTGQKMGRYVPLKNSIFHTQILELSPRHKNLGFEFSAMIYPNAGKVKYAYMLEGFDKDWKYTDALNRNVNYTNLSHGKYIFKVKATNTDGVWDENPTTLSIRIKTPFFYTWMAIILYLVFFVLLFIYFSHYTVIGLTTKRNLLLEKEHNEKLLKLDEMRARFFINISHDLRTPLTLISGPLNNILTNKCISGELNEDLQLIKRNVKRLTDLVEQLLDFRKAEISVLTPKLESLDFISFSNNEISHFYYAAKKKGLELSLESSEKQMIVEIDPGMFAKVYFNILSNAIKHTSAGSIKVKIQFVNKNIPELLHDNSNNRYIQVEICDTGTGITKEQEKLIFDRFYQGSPQDGNGYGIGLSHTKYIIEVHNGLIEAESNPNGGTIIRLFIPDLVSNNATATKGSLCNEDIYINNEDINIQQIDEAEDNSCLKSILVVEDNYDMLNYIRNGLKKNYNIFTANNGTEGLSIALRKMPDLIVSDVMMPGMDGIEFCKAIKSNIITSHIPVILLTAKVDLKTKYEGIETGADDFIPKPFEMEYLLIRINNLLQSRENLRKIFQRGAVLKPSDITVTSVDEKFLTTLMKSIEESISDEEFTINSLESQLGLSHSTFYRKIKTLTGQSGQEFLLNVRIKRAHQILSEKKGLRVSEVAYMVGFSSPKYFTKCFKEYFGYSPSEIGSSQDVS